MINFDSFGTYMHSVGLPTLVIIEVTVSLKTLVAVTTIVLLPTSRLVGGSLPVVWCEEYVAKWGVYRIQYPALWIC